MNEYWSYANTWQKDQIIDDSLLHTRGLYYRQSGNIVQNTSLNVWWKNAYPGWARLIGMQAIWFEFFEEV